MIDPYLVLGVSRDADDAMIRNAYRALAKICHPDLFPDGSEQANERFKNITAAYDMLRTAQRRTDYEKRLRSKQGHEPSPAGGRFGMPQYPCARQSWTPSQIRLRRRGAAGKSRNRSLRQRALVLVPLFSVMAIIVVLGWKEVSGLEANWRPPMTTGNNGHVNLSQAFVTRELIDCQDAQNFRFSIAKGTNTLRISINGEGFVPSSKKAEGDLTILQMKSLRWGRVDFGFFKGDKDVVVVTILDGADIKTISASCSSSLF